MILDCNGSVLSLLMLQFVLWKANHSEASSIKMYLKKILVIFRLYHCFSKSVKKITYHIYFSKGYWNCLFSDSLKGTLMQIFLYVFIHTKTIPGKCRILKFVHFLKIMLIFKIFCCFWMFVNKHFTYRTCTYLKKKMVF